MDRRAKDRRAPVPEHQWFRALMESRALGVLVTDQEGSLTYASPACLRILGMSPSEAAGLGWLNALHPEDLERIFRAWLSGGATVGLGGGRYRLRPGEGPQRWIDVQATALTRDTDDAASGCIGLVEDVTARVADAARRGHLVRRLEQLQSALDRSAILARTDVRGRILEVNENFMAISGYDRAELVGQDHRLINSGHHPKAFFRDLWATIQRGETWRGDVRNRAKDGRVFWMDTTIVPVEDEVEGTQYLAIRFDITAQREADAAARRVQKLQAIGGLSGGVAHDFNNLLGVIIGNLGFLQRRLKEDPENARRVATALRAAQRGAGLTAKLLAFARRDAQNPLPTDLNAVLTGMAEILERSLTEAVAVELKLDPGLWAVRVDPGELEDVILNLAVNARDAMPGGGHLVLETYNLVLESALQSSLETLDPGDYVVLTVSDSGTGMPPEVQARIFEPFFTTKAEGQGTGLGLAMVFGFMQRSRAAIQVYSEPGAGTTFRFYFPRERARVEGDGAASTPMEGVPRASRHRGRLLIVDDEAELGALFRDYLGELGYEAVVAHSGAEALACLEGRGPFDLMLSDVLMPGGMDGFALAKAVAARWPKTRLLLMSGYLGQTMDSLEPWQRALPLMAKPFDLPQAAARIRALLEPPP